MIALLLLLGAGDPPDLTIDAALAARAGGPVAARSGDGEFLRRVTLDLAGTLPTPDEIRAFAAKPDRRALVDRLLAAPAYARRMEELFTVVLLERRGGGTVPDAEWRAWLRSRFAEDAGWDAVVRDMLSADGRDPATRPATKFFLDGRTDPHQMTRDVGRLFLGRDLLCAQCHDHPHIKDWKQSEYMGLYAYLGQSKPHKDAKATLLMETPLTKNVEFSSVFRPDVKKETAPVVRGRPAVELPSKPEWEVPPEKKGFPGVPKLRLRERLAEDLATVEHPQFVRTTVNRVWFTLMGRGLVHPIDMDHPKNPPSHPELLDALSRRFAAGGLRLKPLIREIVLSEAYQRSSRAPGSDVAPESYRVALPRPLTAEQIARSLMTAADVRPAPGGKFGLKEYLNGKGTPPTAESDILALFGAVFGNAPGEPEVEFSPSTTHALFLMNDRLVLAWLKPFGQRGLSVEEIYLRVLVRRPSDVERREAEAFLAKNPESGADLAWALVASAEFRLNH